MDSRRFFSLAIRVGFYQGVMSNRIWALQQKHRPNRNTMSQTPRKKGARKERVPVPMRDMQRTEIGQTGDDYFTKRLREEHGRRI